MSVPALKRLPDPCLPGCKCLRRPALVACPIPPCLVQLVVGAQAEVIRASLHHPNPGGATLQVAQQQRGQPVVRVACTGGRAGVINISAAEKIWGTKRQQLGQLEWRRSYKLDRRVGAGGTEQAGSGSSANFCHPLFTKLHAMPQLLCIAADQVRRSGTM